jgi:hypothetical protein
MASERQFARPPEQRDKFSRPGRDAGDYPPPLRGENYNRRTLPVVAPPANFHHPSGMFAGCHFELFTIFQCVNEAGDVLFVVEEVCGDAYAQGLFGDGDAAAG